MSHHITTMWQVPNPQPINLSSMYLSTIARLPSADRNASATIEDLPDEIIIHIVSFLYLLDQEDMKALKSLGITCRRMRNLTLDVQTIAQILEVKNLQEWKVFPAKKCTPNMLFRFAKACEQAKSCMMSIWRTWLSINRSPFLPVRSNGTLISAVMTIINIDGFEDNAPQYFLFDRLSDEAVVSLFAAALMYQECFLARHRFPVRNTMDRLALGVIRAALRFVFLTKGPRVAAYMFESPRRYGCQAQHGKFFDRPRSPPRGREIVFSGTDYETTQPRITWNIANAVHQVMADDTIYPPTAHRIDRRVELKIPVIINKWISSGRSVDYFEKPGASIHSIVNKKMLHQDLVNCLSRWELGNPLL